MMRVCFSIYVGTRRKWIHLLRLHRRVASLSRRRDVGGIRCGEFFRLCWSMYTPTRFNAMRRVMNLFSHVRRTALREYEWQFLFVVQCSSNWRFKNKCAVFQAVTRPQSATRFQSSCVTPKWQLLSLKGICSETAQSICCRWCHRKKSHG
jgi:hypothetical protein